MRRSWGRRFQGLLFSARYEREQHSRDSALVLDEQEACNLVGAKEQAPKPVFIGRQAERENPWFVAPHKAFYISVEPLGAVIGQEQKTRNALSSRDPCLAIHVLKAPLFCSQGVLCPLQTPNNLAR